jgi:hypothetical protein
MGCLAVSFSLPLLPVPREFSWRDKLAELSAQPDAQPVARTTAAADPKLLRKPGDGGLSNLNGSSTDPSGVGSGAVTQPAEKGTVVVRHKAAHTRTRPARKTSPPTLEKGMATSDLNNPPLQMPVADGHGKTTVAGTPSTPGFSGAMLFFVLKWLFYGYLFGLLLFGGNFLLQIAVLLYQSYSRPVIRDGRFRIVEIRGNRAPCSFGNTIFINPENYDWETYNQILIHEKIHVSGRHTLDILLAEIAVVLQWFNPFVWLYRREVENNLEFLTDASVLMHREVERSAYQLSLLRVSAPHLPFSITNNYNQSLLKRRIVMMNSKRSSLHTVWKYFFLLPILSVLVCALNKPAAFAAAGNSTAPGRSAVPTDPEGGSAKPVSPLKFNRLLATVASAFSDTTVQPASSNRAAAHGASAGRDSSIGSGSSSDDDDNYHVAQKLDALQMRLKEQQMLANNMQLDMVRLNLENVKVHPAMDLNLNIQPMLKIDLDLSHLQFIADTDLREGAWFATTSDDRLSFELKSGDDDHSWSSTLRVEKSEINPFPGQGNVEFKLVREAGTMTFKGQFDGQEGFGHFQFTPDGGYLAALKQMGVEDMDERREFAYFTVNIKKEYVDMLVHNGYPHISQRDLIGFAAMKIDKQFIQDWHGSGFDDVDNPRNLISLKAMKIDRAYVDELKASGYDHLSVHELMSMKAQHIDRAYIKSLGRNSDNTPIPIHELISYKAMHIDSGYLEGLRKVGYDNLPRNEVTSLYAMHVTPEYINSLNGLGFKDIPVRELTSLKAMNITPEYIKGFRDIGFKDINARQLSSFKAMNITPEFIKGFRDIGYEDLSPNELSSLKAMNITPDFVKEFNKIGFDHIPVHMLTSLKATGVNADYVSKMKEKGFVSKDLNKYIRLKNDFN